MRQIILGLLIGLVIISGCTSPATKPPTESQRRPDYFGTPPPQEITAKQTSEEAQIEQLIKKYYNCISAKEFDKVWEMMSSSIQQEKQNKEKFIEEMNKIVSPFVVFKVDGIKSIKVISPGILAEAIVSVGAGAPIFPESSEQVKVKHQIIFEDGNWRIGKSHPISESDDIPALIARLKSKNSSTVKYAADWLGKIGAREAIPELTKLLKDKNKEVRSSAVWGLRQLGGAHEAIPDLIILLNDENGLIRAMVIDTLGFLKAKEAIPEIIKLLDDKIFTSRQAAAYAMGSLGVTKAIPKLVELLKDNFPDVRASAALALGALNAKEAIPEIMNLFEEIGPYTYGYAAIALIELGAKDKVASYDIPSIKTILDRKRNNKDPIEKDIYNRANAALKVLDAK
ncbi:MAG: HEAT repeat domain-containing protein [Planctomycetota bacterium]